MGPSGSGKTTFLNVAGLLDTFDGGRYELDGQDVSRLSDAEMSRIRNSKIGFIFQTFNLIPDLDVFDNVDVPLRYRGLGAGGAARRPSTRPCPSSASARGSSTCPRSCPAGSSSGWRSPGRWWAGPGSSWPTSPPGNLDSAMAGEILDLVEKINETGTTVVMVTHDPELANRASRQIHLLDGKLIDVDAASPSRCSPRAAAAAAGPSAA